jgi:hypothetical protein
MSDLTESIYQLRASVLRRLLQLRGIQVDHPLAELVRTMDDREVVATIRRERSKLRWLWRLID